MASNTKNTPKNETKTKGESTAPSDTTTGAGSTPASDNLQASREKRAAEMSIANKKTTGGSAKNADGTKAAKPEKPAFKVDEPARQKLLDMTDEELVAAHKEQMRAVDVSNGDIYRATGNETDQTNGQPVSRSAVRSAVLHFLNSRKGGKAPVNAIVAYMGLAQGVAYKGKFDYGYLTTKSGAADSRRGMVARKLIELVERGKVEEPAEEAVDA